MKKKENNKKTITSVTCHISATAQDMILIFGTLMISPGVFLIFFLILIFWAVRGVKKKKLAQNEKQLQLHLSHVISQEQYSI